MEPVPPSLPNSTLSPNSTLNSTLNSTPNSTLNSTVSSKRSQPPALSEDQRNMVMRIEDYCKKERECVQEAIRNFPAARKAILSSFSFSPLSLHQRVSTMVGVSTTTVRRIRARSLPGAVIPPRLKMGRKVKALPPNVYYDIRDIVNESYIDIGHNAPNYPTISTVFTKYYKAYEYGPEEKPDCINVPSVVHGTFRNFIFDAGYKFVKVGHSHMGLIISKTQPSVERVEFCRKMMRYRSEGRIIFYMDEMTATEFKRKKMVSARVRDPFLQKECFNEYLFDGTIDLPTIEDEHIIIVSCMSKYGLLKGSEKIIIRKANDEENEYNFEEYIKKTVLPLLPRGSVVVFDQAACHSRLEDRSTKPTIQWPKIRIIEWLADREYVDKNFLIALTRSELLAKADRIYVESKYAIDKMLAKKDIIVVRTPYKHGELNGMEYVWAFIKKYVSENSSEKTELKDFIPCIVEAFSKVSPELCNKIYNHIDEVEKKFYTAEINQDSYVEKLCLQIADFGSDSDSDSDNPEGKKKPTRKKPKKPMDCCKCSKSTVNPCRNKKCPCRKDNKACTRRCSCKGSFGCNNIGLPKPIPLSHPPIPSTNSYNPYTTDYLQDSYINALKSEFGIGL